MQTSFSNRNKIIMSVPTDIQVISCNNNSQKVSDSLRHCSFLFIARRNSVCTGTFSLWNKDRICLRVCLQLCLAESGCETKCQVGPVENSAGLGREFDQWEVKFLNQTSARDIPSPSLSANVFLTVVQVEPSPLQTPQRSSTALDSITRSHPTFCKAQAKHPAVLFLKLTWRCVSEIWLSNIVSYRISFPSFLSSFLSKYRFQRGS